ncbi:hypothetical protein [Paenibacillus sp. FSL L8-0709]
MGFLALIIIGCVIYLSNDISTEQHDRNNNSNYIEVSGVVDSVKKVQIKTNYMFTKNHTFVEISGVEYDVTNMNVNVNQGDIIKKMIMFKGMAIEINK